SQRRIFRRSQAQLTTVATRGLGSSAGVLRCDGWGSRRPRVRGGDERSSASAFLDPLVRQLYRFVEELGPSPGLFRAHLFAVVAARTISTSEVRSSMTKPQRASRTIRPFAILLGTVALVLIGATVLVARRPAASAASEYEFVPAGEHGQTGSSRLHIVPLSARSDMVSGGDLLLRIEHEAG